MGVDGVDGVVVAVDGGGTKTDVAVLGGDGTTLARTRVGSVSPSRLGQAGTAARLDEVVRGLLTEIGDPAVAVASLCLADLDFDFEVASFRPLLAAYGWAQGQVVVENDALALLRVGTDAPTAVAVVCGTGMNCVGRAEEPAGVSEQPRSSHEAPQHAPGRAPVRMVRFAAIGERSGDWGGGWSLGAAAIWHAARAADGRGPATRLEDLVVRALGRSSMDEVILAFHRHELPDDRTPTLAPLIFEAANAGDAVALGVVQRQADEIVAYAVAALTRLDVLGEPVPVVLGGGVVAARHACLLEAVDQGLAQRAPGAYTVITDAPPLVGAALLGFDAVGCTADLEANVRASLAHRHPGAGRDPVR